MILFVHSSGLGAAQWMRLEKASERSGLTQTRRYLDLTGYGATPYDSTRGALEQDVERVVREIAQSDEPVHLVGHSYGGLVAMRAACLAEVTSLTLIEPVAVWLLEGESAQKMDQVIHDFEAHLQHSAEPETSALRGFIEFWSGPGSFEAMPGTIKNGMIARAPKIIAEVRDTAKATVDLNALASKQIPTHVLLSEDCRAEARAMCTALSHRLAAPILMVPGAHMTCVTHPDATVEILHSIC